MKKWLSFTFYMLAFSMLYAGADLAKPDRVLLDGNPAGAAVTVGADGTVVLKTDGQASFIRLEWDVPLAADAMVLGDAWERTYADSRWRRVDDKTAPLGGTMPWYFLISKDGRTDGYGVKVQPNAFACWKVSEQGIVLSLDVRAGIAPVRPRNRRIELCTLVSRMGRPGESAFAAGREFCKMMCPSPRLPKEQVYGYNDWYCAYGKNTATNFLEDVAFIVSLLDRGGKVANRPFAVVDDGWQLKPSHKDAIGPEGQWAENNPRWGMAMDECAAKLKALDVRPGLWYRPFFPDVGGKDLPIDPTDPIWERNIRRDLANFRAWGFELVKIDFITFDWSKAWGSKAENSPCGKKCRAWKDDSRTGAEVIKGLYQSMREAAGDMYIIGCNALDHFAAGLFELQRTGDDTDGRGWEKTRKRGVNTLAMRAIHNRTFYLGDGDCVGLASAGAVPWEKNRQWLDLVAKSGTSLFVSWKRELAVDPEVAGALSQALKIASQTRGTGEPLDWMEKLCPVHWVFDGFSEATYNWDENIKSGEEFTVASYNIRRAGDNGENAWELRLPRICEVIKRHGFSVVGFQESFPSQTEDLKRELKGWESFGRGRSKDHTDEGVPIFWDARRFELKDKGEFWLSSTPDEPGSNDWGGAFPRICTWVKLYDRTTRNSFYHFNTHLDYRSINARKKSAELILKKIAALPKGVPVIVTGDFNDEIGSEKYRAEVKKKDFTILTPPGFDHPLTQMKTLLADARERSKTPPKGTEWSDNGYGKKHVKRIDYIFVSPKFKVKAYETYADRPGGKYPSDHEPIAATLSI